MHLDGLSVVLRADMSNTGACRPVKVLLEGYEGKPPNTMPLHGGRRASLVIDLSCEQCGGEVTTHLTLVAHKGNVFVSVVPAQSET